MLGGGWFKSVEFDLLYTIESYSMPLPFGVAGPLIRLNSDISRNSTMHDCTETTATLTYPKHLFTPEDLLHFIESKSFSTTWDAQKLDLEDDLTSLQVCIMANPRGDREVVGCGGLRVHRHTFGDWSDKADVVTYYAFFEDYGVAYLVYLEFEEVDKGFTDEHRAAIRRSLSIVEAEIKRLQTLR